MREQVPAPTVEMNERYGQTLLPYDPGMEELRETYAAFEVGIAPAIVPEAWKFTRGRIVFPIRNAAGELVAFAARYRGDLSVKKIPKYINSSTSAIYKKDELLYGWHRAVTKVRETGIVLLTEGYKDTLAMHAAGFSNTVALCGTNLSEHHIAMIRKEAVTVCLFLDADEVGRETVTGVMPKLRSAGLRVVDILPEGGKDADEMFRSLGREAFIRWVGKAMIPPARRKAESLLVAVCRRWPLCPDGREGGRPMWIISGKYYLLTICYRLTTLFPRSMQDCKRTDRKRKNWITFMLCIPIHRIVTGCVEVSWSAIFFLVIWRYVWSTVSGKISTVYPGLLLMKSRVSFCYLIYSINEII
ncbi:MAG: toprim domain-containing protein [Parabacteroides sp.]